MVAHVLGVPSNAVTIIVRRMGGGFGGKETQPNLFAAVAALAAKKWGRAVKIRPDRDDDMVATGKRHDFLIDYEVGFDDDGRILAVDGELRGALRVLGGPVRAGDRPGAVPCRQRLFLPERAAGLEADEDEHGLEHRLPRLRRAAGADRRRAHRRGDRLRARQGPARGAQGELLRRRGARRDALPPEGDGQRHRPDRRGARGLVRLCGAAEGGARAQRQGRGDPQGHRADAGEVRDQLHRHLVQPGRRARARLQRRLDPPEPRRHRDGAGPQHQGERRWWRMLSRSTSTG